MVWLVALVGCSFEHGVPVSSGGSDGGPGADAAAPADTNGVMPIDAAIDAVTPCPDDDTDGVCNNVDDWPCGAKPTAPSATLSWTRNSGATQVTITNVNLDGSGRLAVATPGETLSLTFDYAITDTACSGNCVDQLEIGWVPPGSRMMCVFDNAVSKTSGASGTVSTTVQARSNTQVYDLRIEMGQNYSCYYGGANGWWDGQAPGTNRTIAKLCVH